jgi:predicted ArsR family transcriptional regulator
MGIMNSAKDITSRAANRLLGLLRTHGPQTALELAHRIGIGPVSVRAQLRDLEARGLVVRSTEHRPVGRPVARYALTPAADSMFPKRYDLFAAKLLETLVSELGIDTLRKILAHWEEALRAYLDERLPRDPKARLDALADHQSAHGFMAEVRRDSSGVALVERNCPIAAIAAKYPEICEREAALFSRTLGWKTKLVSCQAHGDTCCVFQIGRAPRDSVEATVAVGSGKGAE